MSDWDDGNAWIGRIVVWQPPAQEGTQAREQASPTEAGSELGKLTEEPSKKPTITLQDGSVVAADQAVTTWQLLKDLPHEEPAGFQWLLAQAQGRTDAAEARHFPASLEASGLVNEDHTLESVTRAVLLNSLTTVDGEPMIAALRVQSRADKAVLDAAWAERHQAYSEGSARLHKPGGFFDQLWDKIQRERGKGRSPD